MFETTAESGQAKHEQDVPDDRPGDRCFYYARMAFVEGDIRPVIRVLAEDAQWGGFAALAFFGRVGKDFDGAVDADG